MLSCYAIFYREQDRERQLKQQEAALRAREEAVSQIERTADRGTYHGKHNTPITVSSAPTPPLRCSPLGGGLTPLGFITRKGLP